jgi:hypothetical protein
VTTISNRGLQGQPSLPYTNNQAYAGSDVFVDLVFLDHTGTAVIPTAFSYQLDDISNSVSMIPPTTIPAVSTPTLSSATISGTLATLTFPALTFGGLTWTPAVGTQVTVAGVTNTGGGSYNGTYTITAATTTSVSYIPTSTPGSAGTVTSGTVSIPGPLDASTYTLQIPGAKLVMTQNWQGSQLCQLWATATIVDSVTGNPAYVQSVSIFELVAVQTPASASGAGGIVA